MHSTDRVSDLIIIGGGIIGLSAAFRACAAGLRVTVLDSATVGSGATHVAAGMLSPALEAEDADPHLLAFARRSVADYPAFVTAVEAAAGMSCGLRTDGGLWLALDRDDQVLLERTHAIQQGRDLTTELLSPDQVKAVAPDVSPRVTGGLIAREEMQVDPRRMARALAAAIRGAGGEIIEHAAGIRVIASDGRVESVAWDGGSLAAGAIVIAAGCSTNDLLPDGCARLPLRPVKGQTVRLRGPEVIRHIVSTPRVYLVPRDGGEMVVGATVEEQGFDGRATVWAVHDLLTEARRAVPAIDELAISELVVGFRPTLRDHLPAIGAYGPSGLFVATGHYRHGIMLAVATANALPALLTGGHDDQLAPFDPNRFDRDRTERKRQDRARSPAA
ncbi:MAG: glycine oxidase ThiO [Alphaproteobacteria bacterium]|nr:glycine oxidase ThiO [Alphaproteobacteria bacterium]